MSDQVDFVNTIMRQAEQIGALKMTVANLENTIRLVGTTISMLAEGIAESFEGDIPDDFLEMLEVLRSCAPPPPPPAPPT